MSKSPQAVSRNALLEMLYDDVRFVDENTLNVNVARLRKKLKVLASRTPWKP